MFTLYILYVFYPLGAEYKEVVLSTQMELKLSVWSKRQMKECVISDGKIKSNMFVFVCE